MPVWAGMIDSATKEKSDHCYKMGTTLCLEPMGFIGLPCPIVMVNENQQQLDEDRTTKHLGPMRTEVW